MSQRRTRPIVAGAATPWRGKMHRPKTATREGDDGETR